jgi:hypothetical protein
LVKDAPSLALDDATDYVTEDTSDAEPIYLRRHPTRRGDGDDNLLHLKTLIKKIEHFACMLSANQSLPPL